MFRTPAAATCSLFAALSLSACSSIAGENTDELTSLAPLGPVVTVSPDPSAAPFADRAKLRAALLDIGDLPVGFSPVPNLEDLGLQRTPERTDLGAPLAPATNTDPAECAAILSPVADQRTGAVASASNAFTGPGFVSIDQDAASYETGADAADAFAKIQAILHDCGEYSGTDADGIEVHNRIGGLAQKTEGDASVAFRLITSSAGLDLVSDAMVAIVGNTVTQLVATGQEPIDADVFDGMAHTAVDKLVPAPEG
ncbi:sensor domain-containing protein [Rhodococcus sp. NPDC049939]|uniref:sensor domain-containing protein n=1 Tax=Rhodococcus sp. NPDC049939 TaxID=3155511 RepID=UPI0033D43767